MKKYYRLMLGAKSIFAEECYRENYIGVDFDIQEDLSAELTTDWKEFNKRYIPVWLQLYPEKSKVAAGLACGALWTVCKGINSGDIVLCPNGNGAYYVGEVLNNYYFKGGTTLRHRRNVKWFDIILERSEMSEGLRNSSGSIGTISDISKHAQEIETMLYTQRPTTIIATNPEIEDPTAFALEKHLEDFLVKNWKQTELGKHYDIFEENGELVGQQYPSDTGPIDILAISKDKKTLLVVELKKGRVSDTVVGQIQRYMGYVKEELAESNQTVKGVIIGLEDDIRVRRALAVTTNIEFYRYQISFKLAKAK